VQGQREYTQVCHICLRRQQGLKANQGRSHYEEFCKKISLQINESVGHSVNDLQSMRSDLSVINWRGGDDLEYDSVHHYGEKPNRKRVNRG